MVSRWPSQKWLISTLKVILLFCLPLFSIEMNQNVKSQLNSFCPWEDFKSYLPFVPVHKIYFGFNTKSIKCAWQKFQHTAFLNYCWVYIFKICALWHAIFRRQKRRIALLSKRLWYCCSGIYLLETSNSVINCIITVPDCGLPNGTKLSNFMN